MMMIEHNMSPTRLEHLRKCINDKDYMYAAIQRIALVLSNELMDMSQGASKNERQRKGGR